VSEEVMMIMEAAVSLIDWRNVKFGRILEMNILLAKENHRDVSNFENCASQDFEA
jgi:hypothetical protein